jgi:hypothetical protein
VAHRFVACVEFNRFLPTLAALARAELPAQHVTGRNLIPLLMNTNAAWDDRFLFTHLGRWASGEDPNLSQFKNGAVRTQRFRLVNNQELYDVENDPFEKNNVIDQFPEQVFAMRSAYDTWWRSALPMMVNEQAAMAQERPYWVWYDEQMKNGGIPLWNQPALK